MIVFALATFGCSLPHFIFGDELLHSTNTLYGGGVHNVQNSSTTVDGTPFIGDMAPTMSTHLNLCQNLDKNFRENGSVPGKCA